MYDGGGSCEKKLLIENYYTGQNFILFIL